MLVMLGQPIASRGETLRITVEGVSSNMGKLMGLVTFWGSEEIREEGG